MHARSKKNNMNPSSFPIGDKVDVYIKDDVVWTEGIIIKTDGTTTYTIKLNSVLSPSMTRVIRTSHVAPSGTHCRFDWRSMLRTPGGIGFYVEVIFDNEYHPAKVLHYTDTTDEVLVLIQDKTVLWIDVDSPMMRMGWDWS